MSIRRLLLKDTYFLIHTKNGPEVSGGHDQTSGNPGSPHMHQCISYETTNLIQVTSLWLHRMRIPQTSPKQFDPCFDIGVRSMFIVHPSNQGLQVPLSVQPNPDVFQHTLAISNVPASHQAYFRHTDGT